MFVVSDEFVNDSECRNCTMTNDVGTAKVLEHLWKKSRDGLLDNLTSAECIDAYATTIQSARSNLLVVTARKNPSPKPMTGLYSGYHPGDDTYINNTGLYLIRNSGAVERLSQRQSMDADPLSWLCSGLPYKDNIGCQMRLGELKDTSRPWEISGCFGDPSYCDQYRLPVSHCLSERPNTLCRLHFSPLIAGIVTTLNLCKSCTLSVGTPLYHCRICFCRSRSSLAWFRGY
jgi:hypothetical protein